MQIVRRCKGEFEDFYTYVTKDIPKIFSDLKKYLNENQKTGQGDDW
jgi:hypothetical protein